MLEKKINIENIELVSFIFGEYDKYCNLIEKEFNVLINNRHGYIKIKGEPQSVDMASNVINSLILFLSSKNEITDQTVDYIIAKAKEDQVDFVKELSDTCICITSSGKPIKPKTLGQKHYFDNISKNTVAFGVGPAGTGKTYLAVAAAVKSFKSGMVSRIILTRPAVEAGEKLGFLPGDLQDKVDPYLRPLYDGLFDFFGCETFEKYLEKGIIEVAPLAYMRGRTLDDSFIILDEAQNTTKEQMKMFLTRIGTNSKAVITGDITQIDLPDPKKSGLIDAINILDNLDDIEIIFLDQKDVVRNKIVQTIIRAYDKSDKGEKYDL